MGFPLLSPIGSAPLQINLYLAGNFPPHPESDRTDISACPAFSNHLKERVDFLFGE
jgi:hypothetical protein